MWKRVAIALIGVSLFAAAGCYEDPNDPQTWIKKLKDPREQETAATKLLEIKNPVAVQPLVDLYDSTSDPKYLDDAISFHDKRVIPELVKILGTWDSSKDSTEAVAAAKSASQECIGQPDPSEVPALIHVLEQATPPTGPLNLIKVNAIDALAKIKDKAAVEPLIKVLDTDTATQPILVNTHAAIALGRIGDPRAVPSLIQGLFTVGKEQGETSFVMFPEAKMALVRIGEPAIPGLLDLLNGKDAAVAKMAREGNWEKENPGVVTWKAEAVLGDMHAKRAIPDLLAQLAAKSRGSVQEYALYALGKIGDPASLEAVAKFASDTTRPWNDRLHADEAIVFFLDPRGDAPLLANITNPMTPDDEGGAENLRADAITDYARLAGPDADLAAVQKAVDEEEIPEAKAQEQQSIQEIQFAKKCGKDVACYAKALDDRSHPAEIDEALFQLARGGDKAALPAILTVVPLRDPPTLRDASLFALEKLADRGSTDAIKTLSAVIADESQVKGINHLVEETQITEAYLEGRL